MRKFDKQRCAVVARDSPFFENIREIPSIHGRHSRRQLAAEVVASAYHTHTFDTLSVAFADRALDKEVDVFLSAGPSTVRTPAT
jgi:hypothetical protein